MDRYKHFNNIGWIVTGPVLLTKCYEMVLSSLRNNPSDCCVKNGNVKEYEENIKNITVYPDFVLNPTHFDLPEFPIHHGKAF